MSNTITLEQYKAAQVPKSVRQVARDRKRKDDPEHRLQVQIVVEVDRKFPAVANLLYAVPNGGHRNVLVALKLKKEGVRKGVPDLCLPVARGGFHGLYIEVKVAPNKPTNEQKQWLARLTGQGYCCHVVYDLQQAMAVFSRYLSLTQNHNGQPDEERII